MIAMMIIYYYLDQYNGDGLGCNDFFIMINIYLLFLYVSYLSIIYISMYICRDGSTFIIALSYSLLRYLSVKWYMHLVLSMSYHWMRVLGIILEVYGDIIKKMKFKTLYGKGKILLFIPWFYWVYSSITLVIIIIIIMFLLIALLFISSCW